MLPYPDIDPIALEFGPLIIRWYSLSYIAGLVLGWFYVDWLNRNAKPHPPLTKPAWDSLLLYAVIGVVLGGRLGYVLFYNLPYYLDRPLEIFQVWQGGMAFHGGMLGTILAIYLLCRMHHLHFWRVMDLIACAAPIGLFLGRIANFINGELYGRPTDGPMGMVFPNSDGVPRHPSQLYEAVLEGLVLFMILFGLARFTRIQFYPAALSGIFLIGYGLFRSIAEIFREPDAHIGFLAYGVTMGQILSLPMIALGIFLVIWSRRHRKM